MGLLAEFTKDVTRMLNNGQYQDTIDYCSMIISSGTFPPIDAQAFYMYRGKAYANIGQLEQAIADLEKCVKMIDEGIESEPRFAGFLLGSKLNVQRMIDDLKG